MISNERHWPSGHKSHPLRQPYHPRPVQQRTSLPEDALAIREIQIEYKHFFLMLKQNARGRFLRITEGTGSRISSIIIPAAGLENFHKLLEEIIAADKKIPPKDQPSPQQTEQQKSHSGLRNDNV